MFMPDEELKRLLRENLETSKESLRILRKINRSRIVGHVLVFLKWVIIVGAAAGIYYYIEPYLKVLTDNLGAANDLLQKLQDIMPK